MNGPSQTLIGSAPTNIRDVGIDIGVGRIGELFQERDGSHDLPRLTVAALRNAFRDPRALHWMVMVRRESFDCGDLCAVERTDRHGAGTHRAAVDVHGASAALRDTTAEF